MKSGALQAKLSADVYEQEARKVSSESTQSSPAVESRINSLKNGGQPLPESVKAFLNPA
jgi:hypothetical protein